jgi:hypothetical protein
VRINNKLGKDIPIRSADNCFITTILFWIRRLLTNCNLQTSFKTERRRRNRTKKEKQSEEGETERRRRNRTKKEKQSEEGETERRMRAKKEKQSEE